MVLCRSVSAYYNSPYHIAPLDFGEGGAIVLLSACFLALRSNTQGIRNGPTSNPFVIFNLKLLDVGKSSSFLFGDIIA